MHSVPFLQALDAQSGLGDAVRAVAAALPDRRALGVLQDGERLGSSLTYAQLDRQACRMGASLAQHISPGARVVVACEPGEDFVVAFLGVIYAGAVAVPVPVPRFGNQAERVQTILQDAGAAAIIVRDPGHLALPPGVAVLAPDDASGPAGWIPRFGRGEDLAFIQYTSGSTSAPKGVTVTHASVLANSRLLRRALGYDAASVSLTWLPPSHDMGLIEGLLQPILHGVGALVLAPDQFLRHPLHWLKAIDSFRVTHSGGPNFAYQLCIERAKVRGVGALDLSSWRLAYVGAEPIRHAVLQEFGDTFAACGFRRTAWHASYGLAEATLLVSEGPAEPVSIDGSALEQGRIVRKAAGSSGARTLVSCGRPYPEMRLGIFDPETGQTSSADTVGEICIAGASVTRGYWAGENRPALAEPLLDNTGQAWLRTGDLGFLDDGKVVITGRRKELIILNGRNLFPQDIELAIKAAVPGIRRTPVAFDAFGLAGYPDGGLVIAIEAAPAELAAFAELREEIQQVVAEEFAVECTSIVAIARGEVRQTTSGKVMRGDLRQRFGRGELRILDAWSGAPGATSRDAMARAETVGELLAAKFGPVDAVLDKSLAQLGGESLFAARLANAISQRDGVAPHPAALLRMTLRQILTPHIDAEAGHKAVPLLLDQARPPGSAIPATAAQRGLFFLHQMWGDRDPFVLTFAALLAPQIDAARFAAALRALTMRHPLLRSAFRESDAQGIVEFVELAEPDALVEEADDPTGLAFETARISSASLRAGALFSACLYRSDGQGTGLLIRIHHAVADAASLVVAWSDLARLYAGEQLEQVPVHAPDREGAEIAERGAVAAQFWRSRLAGAPLGFELPPDFQRPVSPTFASGRETCVLPEAACLAIDQIARTRGISPAAVCLAAFAGLCMRQTDSRDIVVGIPVRMRTDAEAVAEVGLLARTVLTRIAIERDAASTNLLDEADRALFDAQVQQPFLLEPLLRDLDGSPAEGVPVPRLLFNWLVDDEEGLPVSAWAQGWTGHEIGNGGLRATLLEAAAPPAYHDLTLHITLVSGRYHATAHYAREVFRPERIARLLTQFGNLAAQLALHPDRPLSDLDLLGPDEVLQLDRFAGPDEGRAPARCLHLLFRDQVARTPDAIAVATHSETLSYGQLDQLSNALALRMQDAGIVPGDRVGIHLDRGAELVISKLAVLKAGAAYVPLDPRYPAGRLAGMVEDARLAAVISQVRRDWLEGIPTFDPEHPGLSDGAPVLAKVSPDSPAYVLFTSGTTGRPKGVVISHRSAAGLLFWAHREFGPALARVFASTSASFDLSIFETFAPLTSGGMVIVADSLLALPEMADAFRPTLASGVPSVFAALLERGMLPSLQALAVAGEPLSPELADRLIRASPGVTLYDLYGPTEVTTYATGGRRGLGDRATIGKPLPWTRAYLLDQQLQRAPMGANGEIWLGGDRVAQGYFGRPDWTADRFRPDPFAARPGALMYRTGDAGCFRPDGTLLYKGRLDRQIKLRGFRIEQGEIESVIAACPGVTQVAVLVEPGARGSAGDRLVACVAAPPGTTDAISHYAAQQLPAFMVPAAIYLFDALPLTPNGKLDRDRIAALAATTASGAHTAVPQEPGASGSEQLDRIMEVIAAATGISGIAADANPFALGATSLDAVRIQQGLRTAFGIELPLRAIIEDGAPVALAASLGMAAPARQSHDADSNQEETLPMSRPLHFAERQLLAASSAYPGSSAFHIPVLLQLAEPVTAAQLDAALARLLDRHPVLWQRLGQSGLTVEIAEDRSPLPVIQLPGAEQDQFTTWARRPFDLGLEPALRLAFADAPDTIQTIGLTAHHLFLDGASLAPLIADLVLGLRRPDHLQGPRQVLRQPCAALPDEAAIAYWRSVLSGAGAAFLPVCGGDSSAPFGAGATERLTLPETCSDALRACSQALATTPFSLLLTTFLTVLAAHNGLTDQVVAVPFDLRLATGCGDAAGMFAQPVLVRVKLADDESLAEAARIVRAALADALEHGAVPFEQVLAELPGDRSFGDSFYRILFASQDGLDAALTEAGGGARLTMLDTGEARADITALVKTDGTGPIELAIEYRQSYYGQAQMEALLQEWSRAIAKLANAQDPVFAIKPLREDAVNVPPTVPAIAVPQTGEADLGAVTASVADAWAAVLGRPPAQDESFFMAGGDSLTAVRLIGRIEQDLGVRLTLREFFGRTTLLELSQTVAEHVGARDQQLAPALPQRVVAALRGPLSMAQQQLLFFERLRPGLPLYNVGLAYELVGTLDSTRLSSAIKKVTARYAALRLRLDMAKQLGGQSVQRSSTVQLEMLRSGEDPMAVLRDFLARTFDLAEGAPLRAGLVQIHPGTHLFALSAHHAAVDAQSLALISKEIGRLYRNEPLDPPDQFGPIEYALWEQASLDGPAARKAQDYWREQLAGAQPALNLPFDPAGQDRAGTIIRTLDEAISAQLRSAGQRSGVGTVAVVLAAFAQLLSELSGKDRVVIGLPVNTRRSPHLDSVGFFSNTVPFAITVKQAEPLEVLLQRTRHTLSQAQDMGWLPLPAIVEVWQPPRDTARPALFHALFAMETGAPIEIVPGGTRRLAIDLGLARCDVLLLARETGSGIELQLQHAAPLGGFDPTAMLDRLQALLNLVAASAQTPQLPTVGKAALLSDTAAIADCIQNVWRDILGITTVPEDRSFFELGGSSLQLVQVQIQLEARLGREVPLSVLFSTPLLADLAAALAPDVKVGSDPRRGNRAPRDRWVQRRRLPQQRTTH
jgi:amino acid adenylation domain-containing protein